MRSEHSRRHRVMNCLGTATCWSVPKSTVRTVKKPMRWSA